MLEWAGLGAIVFALFIFCARIMRRGLSTLDDDRQKQKERIAEEKRMLSEDNKRISAQEQLYLAEAAIRDLLRLEQKECSVEVSGHTIRLDLGEKTLAVHLLMRELSLRSRRRALHGQSRWQLEADGVFEDHRDIAALMRSLGIHLRGGGANISTPPHLARRLAAAKNLRQHLQSQLSRH